MSTDYTLEPAASKAALALADLLSAGDEDPAGLTLGSQDPGTTTDTSKATEGTPKAGKRDLTRKNLKRITKRPGAPRWTIRLAKAIAEVWGDKKDPGPAEKKMWKVICDSSGKEHIESKAKEEKKKARRKEKKKAKKLHKSKKKSKKSKDDTSSSWSSTSSSLASSLSSSSSSSSSLGSKKKKTSKSYVLKSSTSGGKKPVFKILDGTKYFKDKAGS